MKSGKKIFVSLVVALCLLFSACSDKITERTAEASGGCGADLKWYYQDHSLVIRGNGAMTDFSENQRDVPWENYKKEIEEIIIEDGCTAITISAFSDCERLSSVTIPDSVSVIDDYAFSGCHNLSAITLPSNLAKLGNLVFMGCNLTTITIPPNTSNIYGNPFAGCESLQSIDSQSSDFILMDGALFNRSKTLLIAYPNGKTGLYSIPNGVTEIGISAFMGCKVSAVEIPDSVNKIGNGAFWGCENITSITIPQSVTEIGNSAFRSCDILKYAVLSPGLSKIGISAFSDCVELSSIKIPDSVIELGDGAFLACNGPILVPDSVEKIGPRTFDGVDQVFYNGTVSGSPWGADVVSNYTDDSVLNISDTSNEASIADNSPDKYTGILPGTYLVGTDIPAGTYKLVPLFSEYPGYWLRSSNASGEPDSIIANDLFEATTYVTVASGEYLQISRCTGALQ